MSKRWYYVLSLITFTLIGAGITAALMSTRHANMAVQAAAEQTTSPTGLPLRGPVLKPTPSPLLTRDDLVTRGNADDKEEIKDLFYAYIFYHDSHNGPGVASLFTDDGILETLWNNGGKTFEPNAGPHGKGCLEYGHKQIADMFGYNPAPFVGHSHNQVTNVAVQVRGDTATLYANWTTIRSNDPNSKTPAAAPPNTADVSHNGEYISDLVKTKDGWRFLHERVAEDEPAKFGTQVCEDNVAGKQ